MALGAMSLLALASCGAEEHENDPRPALPIEITVSISEKSVNVSPDSVGFGSADQQQLTQNDKVKPQEIDRDVPQTVNFTISNTTDFDTALEIQGPSQRTSGPVVANGTGEFKVSLPTGDYTIGAADIPGATAADLSVGPKRYSSSSELLLP